MLKKKFQLKIPNGVTSVMEFIIEFHEKCLLIIIFVLMVVFVLLKYKFINKNSTMNNLENTGFEILWTLVPTVLIMSLVVPSLSLLYFSELSGGFEFSKKVKVIGHQWYWSYETPKMFDGQSFSWDSYMINTDDLNFGEFRNMEVDRPLVLGVGEKFRLLVTSEDVIHSWSLPEAGMKLDGLPGRLNQVGVNFDSVGRFFGFCTELCGVNHSFMPVVVEVVDSASF